MIFAGWRSICGELGFVQPPLQGGGSHDQTLPVRSLKHKINHRLIELLLEMKFCFEMPTQEVGWRYRGETLASTLLKV